MKKLLLILVGFLFAFPLISQNEYQQEIICPCFLEYNFPKTYYRFEATYGGVPVIRFDSALIEDNALICIYEGEFATIGLLGSIGFSGFGFMQSGKQPYDITLTLIKDYLDDWRSNSNTVTISSTCRGAIAFPVCAEGSTGWKGGCGWYGAFYSEDYNEDAVRLKRTFEGEARISKHKNGFIISSTKTGLYTPAANTEEVSNPSIKVKKSPIPLTKEKKKPNIEKKKKNTRRKPKRKSKEEKKLIERKKIN